MGIQVLKFLFFKDFSSLFAPALKLFYLFLKQ